MKAWHPDRRELRRNMRIAVDRCERDNPIIEERGYNPDIFRAITALYPVPNQLAGEASARRYVHADVCELSDQALWREMERCRFILAWLDAPDGWYLARWTALKTENKKRSAQP